MAMEGAVEPGVFRIHKPADSWQSCLWFLLLCLPLPLQPRQYNDEDDEGNEYRRRYQPGNECSIWRGFLLTVVVLWFGGVL